MNLAERTASVVTLLTKQARQAGRSSCGLVDVLLACIASLSMGVHPVAHLHRVSLAWAPLVHIFSTVTVKQMPALMLVFVFSFAYICSSSIQGFYEGLPGFFKKVHSVCAEPFDTF